MEQKNQAYSYTLKPLTKAIVVDGGVYTIKYVMSSYGIGGAVALTTTPFLVGLGVTVGVAAAIYYAREYAANVADAEVPVATTLGLVKTATSLMLEQKALNQNILSGAFNGFNYAIYNSAKANNTSKSNDDKPDIDNPVFSFMHTLAVESEPLVVSALKTLQIQHSDIILTVSTPLLGALHDGLWSFID